MKVKQQNTEDREEKNKQKLNEQVILRKPEEYLKMEIDQRINKLDHWTHRLIESSTHTP